MFRMKKYIMVVDVEGTKHGYVYDIGYAVVDLQGNIYETYSAIVSEVFFGMHDEMSTAYYADKIPKYGKRVCNRQTVCTDIDTVRQKVFSAMERFKIKTVAAYNVKYDRNALNRTISYISDGYVTSFFPAGTIYWDIWGMACETILKRKSYTKQAIEKGWISKKGNIKSRAEYAYKYLSGNDEFEEDHTGLEDVLIETIILAATIATHKKMTRTEIPNPWKLIQN